MFPDKICGGRKGGYRVRDKACTKKDSRYWSIEAAGSVCHWLCHQKLALSALGMHESKRKTVQAHTWKH